jgi:hypothetical protein
MPLANVLKDVGLFELSVMTFLILVLPRYLDSFLMTEGFFGQQSVFSGTWPK